MVARVALPLVPFPARQMNFVLRAYFSFGAEQVRRVEQLALCDGRVAAAYDVNAPKLGKLSKKRHIPLGIVIQVAHRLAQITGVHEREQLRGENLGKHHKLGLVLASGFHDEADLVLKALPIMDRAQ